MMPGESKEAQDAKHVASMRRTATDNPTSIYRPTGTGAGWGWGMAALDGKPFYTWFDVPRMIRDPRVRFLERMWRSPFQQATWTVKATHPKVQQYVDSQLKKFWRESLPALLQRYFWFGFAPGGAEFSQRKGLVRLDGVRPLEPLDARPLLFHGGPHDGRMAGLEFGTTKVYLPHAFWFSGEKRFGPYYDMPPAGGMFEPWAEKRGRNGAIDMRRTWFHKNSSRGIVVRHPPGRTESSDEFPGGRDNQSIARELIDYSETNSSLTLTNEKHPSDPSHFAWEVEWPESFPDRAGFREYPKDLDAEMAEGVGIPREVLEAAATGSGYSGRQIPLQAWLGGVDEYVGMLLRSCEWLKWAVMINFGPNAYFEVETESLVKKLLEDSKGPGGMGGAVQNMVNPQPQPGGDAQGKIPPGMVPHKGPRGGGGYEDPNTGRRRYLSDERSPSDELSEEQIARRVAKMLLRKHREEQAALELSDGRTPDLATHRKQLLVLLAMLEFQRRAHAVGDSASSAPYLEALTQYLKNPNSLRYPLELSWRADETRTGHIRAVGEAEHAGRVLYGARAEAALRAQEGLRSGLKPGERAPKTPTPHANRDQWQKAGLRAREILAKVAGYEHTPEDLQELGQHLPYLPMDRLMNARSILRAKFKGARGRLAQVGALMDHIREQVGVMDQKATEEAKVAEAVGDAVPVHPLDYLAANHANPELMAGKKQDLAIHDAINAAYRGEFGPEMKAAVNKGGHWDNHGGDIAKRFASIGKAIAEAKQKPKEEPAAPMDEKHSKRAKGYRDEATSVDPKDVSHADTHEASAAAEQPAADVPGFAEGGNLFDKSQFDTDDRPEAIQTLHTILGHAKQFVPGIGAPTAKHAEKLAAYNAEAKRYDAKAKELEDRKKSGTSVFTKRDAGRLTDYKRWADDARKNAAKLTGGAAEVDDYLDQLAAVDKHAGEDADEGFFGKLSENFRGNADELAGIDVETHAEAQEHVNEIMDQVKRDFGRIDRTRKDIIQDLSLKGKTDLAEFYSRQGKEATRLALADLEKRAQEKLESHKQRDEKNKAEQEELERKNGEEADAKIAEHNARMDEQDREASSASLAAYDDPMRLKANVKNGRGVTERDTAILDLQDAHESAEHFKKRIANIKAMEKYGPLTTAAKNDIADFEEQLRAVQKKKAKAAKRLADLDQPAPQAEPENMEDAFDGLPPVEQPSPEQIAKRIANAKPAAESGTHPALAHLDPVKHAREAAHVDAGEDALLEKVRQTGNAFHEAQQAHRMVGSSQPEKRNATKAMNAAAKAHEAAQAEVDQYNRHRPNHNARLNGVAVDEKQPLFVRIAAARRAMGGHTGNVVEEILPHVKQYLEENGHDPRVAEAVAADAMNFPVRSAKKLKEVIQGEETRQKMYDERKEAREHAKGLDLLPHHAAEAEREAGNLYQGDVKRFKEKWSGIAENTKAEKARQVEAERIAKERAEKENASKSAADAYLAAHREGKTLPALAPDAAREVASHVLMAPTQWHAGTELPKADGPKGIVDRLAKEDSTRFALAKTITEQGWGTDSKYAVKATPAMVEHAKAKGLDKLEGRTPPVEDFIKQALAQNLSPAKIVATKQKAEDGLPDVLVQSEDGTKQATLDGRYVANIMGIYPKATMQVAGEGKPVVFMVGDEPVGLVMPRATGDDARIEQFSPHARPQFSDVFAPGSYAPEGIEEMGDAVVAGRGEHSMRLRILGRKGGGYTISSSHKPADNVADREYPNRGEAVAAAKEMLAHAHGIDEDGKLIFKAKGEKPGDLHPEEKARVGYYKDLREKVKAVKGKPQKMAFGDGEKEVHPATEHFGVAKGKTGGWEALHLPSGLSIGDWARKDDAIGHAIATQEMPGADWNDTFADTDDEGVKADRKELFDRARKLRTAFENNELPEHAKPTDQPDEPGAGEAATPKPPQGPSPISATSPAMAPKAGEQQTFAGWMPGASTPRKPAEAKPRARGNYEWRKNKSDKWAWFEGDRQITGAFPNESDGDYAFDAFALKDGSEQSEAKPSPTIKDHPEYDRLNQVYGGMTKQEIDKKLSQMDTDIAQNQHVAKREFNQNGGRRSGPAMAAQAARDLGEEKLLLKAYQNEKFPSEPQAAGADSGPVVKPDAMKNPFREQHDELQKRIDQLTGGTAHDKAMADAFPFGTGRPGNASSQQTSKRSAQRIETTIDNALKAQELIKKRNALKAKADQFDSGMIDKNGLPTQKAQDEQERRRKLKQDADGALAEHMRTTLKPGDTVYINGDTPITVKKANKATVTTDLGSTWKYSELTPKHQSEDRPMTAREMVDLARGKMAEKDDAEPPTPPSGPKQQAKVPHEMTRAEYSGAVPFQSGGPGVKLSGRTKDGDLPADRVELLNRLPLDIGDAGFEGTTKLRSMQQAGLVKKNEHRDGSRITVSWDLTDKGREALSEQTFSPGEAHEKWKSHEKHVRDALAAGKTVPPEVLADYPDLAAKYAPERKQDTSPPERQDISDSGNQGGDDAAGPAPEVSDTTRELEKHRIEDFGEKIGGARKDTATPLGPRPAMSKPKDERPGWARRYHVGQDAKTGRWFLSDQKKKGYGGLIKGDYATKEEAEAVVPLIEVARNHRVHEESRVAGATPTYAIHRVIGDRKRPVVKGGFASRDEAMKYMAKHAEEIINHEFNFPSEVPHLEHIQRIGAEKREGNIAPNDFQKAFGFRGGEFGNWNQGEHGQAALNHAYDALHDLADVLGADPKAVSLNGNLAIAFGARGHGGKDAARAHYERDKAVINLTKIKGAGTLAHEWFHALDHHIGKLMGKTGGDREGSYASHGAPYNSKARKELTDAFKNVMDTIHAKIVDEPIREDHAEKRMGYLKEAIASDISDIMTRLRGEQQYNKRFKPFTPEEQVQWDGLLHRMKTGGFGKKVFVEGKDRFGGYESYEALQDLNAMFNKATGRSFITAQPDSTGRRIVAHIKSVEDQAKRVEQAQGGATEQKKRGTDYLHQAKNIDSHRLSDYWSSPHELAARAFEGYVHDKIKDRGGRSDYLAYGTKNNALNSALGKPYPEGEERTAIHAAFDRLLAAIDHAELHSGLPSNASRTEAPPKPTMTPEQADEMVRADSEAAEAGRGDRIMQAVNDRLDRSLANGEITGEQYAKAMKANGFDKPGA